MKYPADDWALIEDWVETQVDSTLWPKSTEARWMAAEEALPNYTQARQRLIAQKADASGDVARATPSAPEVEVLVRKPAPIPWSKRMVAAVLGVWTRILRAISI